MITVNEAIAVYQSVPSVTSLDGADGVKRRALAIEIVRNGSSWNISMPRSETITLASGKTVEANLSPLRAMASDFIAKTVTIGGVDYPIALAFAIINQFYVDAEKNS
jgi:hypothetical protein